METTVELLFVRLGSLVVELTVAVFEAVETELKVEAFTLIVTIAKAPAFIDPKLQVTVPPACEHDPCVVDTEVKVTWGGSGSLTVTP